MVVDRLGQKCNYKKCTGILKELSIDTLSGLLTCTKCKRRINRYTYDKTKKRN